MSNELGPVSREQLEKLENVLAIAFEILEKYDLLEEVKAHEDLREAGQSKGSIAALCIRVKSDLKNKKTLQVNREHSRKKALEKLTATLTSEEILALDLKLN